jgi:tetratricopeptide (TPR) repeat protein
VIQQHVTPPDFDMDAHHDDSLLQACERLIQVRRLDLAERELGRWLSMHPDDAYAHALMAWTHTLQGHDEEAMRSAGEAVQLDPEWAYTHAMMAEVHERFGRHVEAERSILEALALDPHHGGYYALLAAALLNQGSARTEEALRASNAGLAADPGDADCARLRAEALLRLGRRRQAREAAALALKLAPDAAASHAAAGWIELKAGNLEESREHMREALRMDPLNETAASGLRLAGDGPRFCAALVVQAERWVWPLTLAAIVFAAELALLAARGRLGAFVLGYSAAVLAALEGAMVWVRIRHPGLLAESRHPGAVAPNDQRDARWVLILGVGALLVVPLGMLLQ